MFSPAYTRPPKPPGTRRAGLRSVDGQAPPLPNKHDLFKPAPTSKPSSPLAVPKSAKGKVKASSPLKESTAAGDDHDDQASDDSDATHVSPHNNNNNNNTTRAPRPLSLISESSASMVSPPPPYGYRRTSTTSPLADVKRPQVHNVPPPPEPLESGPSSVRTSMISVDNVDLALEVDDDDDAAGNTLTLRGVQRLIKQQELDAMADEITSRLMLFASPPRLSPRAASATVSPVAERRPLSKSPSGSRQHAMSPQLRPHDKTPPHLRTVPSDPSLAFSHPQPRAPSDKLVRPRDVRLSMLRAEEDEARILELEDALAEARDSEESQRRAAARLRRDMDKLRRQLERAEDAALERERLEYALAAATLEMSNRREQRSFGRSSQPVAFAVRSRGGFGPPSSDEDDRVGWGSTTFPEFARDRLAPFDDAHYAHQELYEASSAEDHSASHQGTVAAGTSEVDLTDPPATLLERGRSRPTISSATFLSPGRSGAASPSVSPHRLPLTPRLQVDAPTSSVRGGNSNKGSLRARRTPYPTLRPATNEGSLRLHRRAPSTASHGSVRSHATKNSRRSESPQSGISQSPLSSIASRMGSVRSFLSDYLGVRRSLGSELGSNYAPSPMSNLKDLEDSPDENEETTEDEHFEDAEQHVHEDAVQHEGLVPVTGRPIVYKTPENQLSNQLSLSLSSPKVTTKGPLSPTAAFVLRGQLAKHIDSSAYDSITETGAPRRIRWADWSPRSWPSPSPSPQPRDVPLPQIEDDIVPQITVHSAASSRFQVSAPADTDSPPGSPAHLAPAGDPWDEYSDRSSMRATPSPRTRIKNAKHLRPLVLCTTPVVQARDTTLALAAQHRRNASTSAVTVPTSHVVPIGHRRALSNAPNPREYRMFTGRAAHGPTTIPGRVMHDFFCLALLFLDYLEWAIILFWRLFLDIRAGPEGALGPQRRNHKKRFYI
ncbi:hypothetical protein Q8F55_004421 [Vanrija albida]|uniref:Uncharacterized protein n=1 Tax=Vanrija albida TaxID=181172 RepID=A0ABR3Q6N8_9TREE